MTDERKNEIWAMLDSEDKNTFQTIYKRNRQTDWDNGYDCALADIFGSDNLTAQAEEKPKEPKEPKEPTCTQTCTDDSSICISQKEDAYFAYRLDLAKEIAVAVIQSDRWDFYSCDPVEQANWIVKRLKETEE